MITRLLLVHVTYMGDVLRAHPVCGESHIQRNANREVATTSPPFHNEPHRSHILFVMDAPGTTFTSWSQHHFVTIGKPAGNLHPKNNLMMTDLNHCWMDLMMSRSEFADGSSFVAPCSDHRAAFHMAYRLCLMRDDWL